jgi:hypothetical protein
MNLGFTRARGGVLALAVALASAAAVSPRAEEGRTRAAPAGPELQQRADRILDVLRGGGAKVSYGSAEAGAAPGSLVLKNIQIDTRDHRKMAIAEVDVRDFDWDHPKQPRHVDLTFSKLEIAVSQLDFEAQQNFKDLGLTSLTIGGTLDYAFDDAGSAFEVKKAAIDVAELGELRFRFKLTGITPGDIETATGMRSPARAAQKGGAHPDVLMSLLSRLNIAGADVAFKDKSLVERMIRSDAKKKSMSEHAARTQILDGLAEERSKAEDDVTREILDAAIKFVKNPGEIELTATPPEPANLMMAFMTVMGNRTTFKQLIGLAVTVK